MPLFVESQMHLHQRENVDAMKILLLSTSIALLALACAPSNNLGKHPRYKHTKAKRAYFSDKPVTAPVLQNNNAPASALVVTEPL